VQYNFVSVPLVVTLDEETLIFVLNQAEVRCVVASLDLAPKIFAVADKCPLLRGVVVMGTQLPIASAASVQVLLFDTVIKMGDENFPGDYPGRERKATDLITVEIFFFFFFFFFF
jgi:long-subunit acyl-CoA synthetase (AMP-forming)